MPGEEKTEMKLCMKHWNHLKANTPENTWLLGNLFIMQKVLDKLGSKVYNMQIEIGDSCPVCFIGEEILEEAIQEIEPMGTKWRLNQ